MTEIRLYFEGDKSLKPGFHRFLAQIRNASGDKGIRLQLIAGRGSADAEADFQLARKTHRDAWNVLLRDSEVANPPHRDSVFWMVQLMEAWFLADPEALVAYYGNGFQANALKRNPQVEKIPKVDVLRCLARATTRTKKGAYDKTKHAPAILESLNPDRVRAAAPNCERLFAEILERLISVRNHGR